MTTFTTTIAISGDTFTEFEVTALFEIETQSGSTSGDTVTIFDTWATSWELIHINLDGLKIGRGDVARMIGEARLRQIEDAAVDEFLEQELAA